MSRILSKSILCYTKYSMFRFRNLNFETPNMRRKSIISFSHPYVNKLYVYITAIKFRSDTKRADLFRNSQIFSSSNRQVLINSLFFVMLSQQIQLLVTRWRNERKIRKNVPPSKWGLLCHFYQKLALKTKAHNPCMINYWHLNTHENIKYDGVKSKVWFFCPSSCSLYFAKLQKNNTYFESQAVKL